MEKLVELENSGKNCMLFSAGWGTKEAENVFLTHCGRTRESWEVGQATFCCCLAMAWPVFSHPPFSLQGYIIN